MLSRLSHRYWRGVLPLLAVLLGPLSTSAADPAAPELEVVRIPREDLNEAPGWSSEGVFLPLSEIRRLVDDAGRPGSAGVLQSGPSISSVSLVGERPTPASAWIQLEGTIAYETTGDSWAGVCMDEASLPWTSYSPGEADRAFLARIGQETWLFARGGSGAVNVEGLAPARFGDADGEVALGTWHAPVHLTLDMHRGLGSVTCPSLVEWHGSTIEAWPVPGEEFRASFAWSPALAGGAASTGRVIRTVALKGAGVEVTDRVEIQRGFEAGERLEVPLPGGLRVLHAESVGTALVRLTSGTLEMTALEGARSVGAIVHSSLRVSAGKCTLPAWESLPVTLMEGTDLSFDSDDQMGIVPIHAPESLRPVGGEGRSRRYSSWAASGDLELQLVPSIPTALPVVKTSVRVGKGTAEADVTVQPGRGGTSEVVVVVPSGWLVEPVGSGRVAAEDGGDGSWRLRWPGDAGGPLPAMRLRTAGRWGGPGTAVPLVLPFLRIPGDRPTVQRLDVTWPESMDIGVGEMEGVSVAAAESARAENHLEMEGWSKAPRATMAVQGRETDLRATSVLSLSVAEDRTMVRGLVHFDVALSPTHMFRVRVPGSTGADIRVSGEGIRESVVQGDSWTITTQQEVLGSYELVFEWYLGGVGGGKVLAAPSIEATGVSVQQSFIVLEGSETLRLEAETRRLSETDISLIPPLPWGRSQRLLVAYRTPSPQYELKIKGERFQAAPLPEGVAREASLLTSVSADGDIFTRVLYTLATTSDRQFLDVVLPKGATLWSVLVDDVGTRAARRAGGDGRPVLMVPIPESHAGRDVSVSITYRQSAPALATGSLGLASPHLFIPVNRTVWKLSLPAGFEYLSFDGMPGASASLRESLARFVRTAYVPSMVVFPSASPADVVFACFALLIIAGILRFLVRNPRALTTAVGSSGFRLIELLVVLAIIAILAAIAVPNFLEAQDRSKVSRARSDMRSLATAIESYYIDNNQFPDRLEILSQGSVKYINSLYADPFSDVRGAPLKYAREGAWERAVDCGLARADEPPASPASFWMLWSHGPDTIDNDGRLLYDPTNGTVSPGDVVRIRDVGGAPATYSNLRRGEARRVTGAEAGNQRPSSGTLSDEAAYPVESDAVVAATSPDAEMARSDDAGARAVQSAPAVPSPFADSNRTNGATKDQRTMGRAKVAPAEEMPSQAVGIKGADSDSFAESKKPSPFETAADPASPPPSQPSTPGRPPVGHARGGGDQTGSEGVPMVQGQGGESSRPATQTGLLSLAVEVPEGGVQRQFEKLGADADLRVGLLPMPRFLRIRFVIFFSVLVIMGMVWLRRPGWGRPAFLSLVGVVLFVPLLPGTGSWIAFLHAGLQGALLSLVVPLVSLRRMPVAAVFLLLCMTMPTGVQAAGDTIRVVSPYDAVADLRSADPVAMLPRAELERLWALSHRDEPTPRTLGAFLTSVQFEGAVSPSDSSVTGTLALVAVNPDDVVTTLALALDGIRFEGLSAQPGGAMLAPSDTGQIMVLPAHWSGRLVGAARIPCRVQGATGSLRIRTPIAAAGQWRIDLPVAGAEAWLNGRPALVESRGGRATLLFAQAGGEMDVRWGPAADRPLGQPLEAVAGVRLDTTVTWASLAAAGFTVRVQGLRQEAPTSGGGEWRLHLDPGWQVTAATGPGLRRARVEGSDIVIEPAEAGDDTVLVSGILPGSLGGMDLPGGTGALRQRLRLAIGDGVSVVSLAVDGLKRLSTTEAQPGFATHVYEGEASGARLRAELRRAAVPFDVSITEVMAPVANRLERTARVQVTPRDVLVHELLVTTPPGVRVDEIRGDGVSGWMRCEDGAHLFLGAGAAGRITVQVIASGETGDWSEFPLVPLRVSGAASTRDSVSIVAPEDREVVEIRAAGVTSRTPGPQDEGVRQLLPEVVRGLPLARSYDVPESGGDLVLGLRDVAAASLDTAYNLLAVSDGLQSLDAVLLAQPTRGRLRQVTALVLLPGPDPMAPARLRTHGPFRHVQVTPLSESMLKVTADLASPVSTAVALRLQLEEPVDTDRTGSRRGLVMVPASSAGTRAWMALRRSFEGDLSVQQGGGVSGSDSSQVPWPQELGVAPSDRVMEVAPQAREAPGLEIVRHSRSKALRAVVQTLRERQIITDDGRERHELEIVLENESEQFLEVQLPYPVADVEVFEVQVASRIVKAGLQSRGGNPVLQVPLIRTGLLEPEFTVRIAFEVGGKAMGHWGTHEARLPSILGDVPVAQSSLVLFLPSEFAVSGFDGTLNKVQMVDLELQEAVRKAKTVERLSQAAVQATGATQQALLGKLSTLNRTANKEIAYARQQAMAYRRESQQQKKQDAGEAVRERLLDVSRDKSLQEAEVAARNALSNIAVANEKGQQFKAEPQAMIVPEPVAPLIPAIQFPRVGEAYVFRQLHGVGFASYRYRSKEITSTAGDVVAALFLFAGACFVLFGVRWLLSSRWRVAILLVGLALLGIGTRSVLDLSIPILFIAVGLLVSQWRTSRLGHQQ